MLVDRIEPREGAHRVELGGEPRLELERGQVDGAHMQVLSAALKSTGRVKSSGTASRSTVMPDSTTSLIALKPTQAPEKRDSAQP